MSKGDEQKPPVNEAARIVNSLFLDSDYEGKDWEAVRTKLIEEFTPLVQPPAPTVADNINPSKSTGLKSPKSVELDDDVRYILEGLVNWATDFMAGDDVDNYTHIVDPRVPTLPLKQAIAAIAVLRQADRDTDERKLRETILRFYAGITERDYEDVYREYLGVQRPGHDKYHVDNRLNVYVETAIAWHVAPLEKEDV